jgi:hypothetical protein
VLPVVKGLFDRGLLQTEQKKAKFQTVKASWKQPVQNEECRKSIVDGGEQNSGNQVSEELSAFENGRLPDPCPVMLL